MRSKPLHQNPKPERGVKTFRGYATALLSALVMLAAPVHAESEPPAQARGLEEADYRKMLADKASAIVTVKFVLKVKSTWGDSDNESEATGVMIEPNGLVLCSNTSLGGYNVWTRRSGGTATPTDIKVLIGDDTEGLDAQLIARDSELDLTWIRIQDPGDKKFTFVDLKASAVPSIGERLYSVARLGRYFDRAPIVREGRLGGIASKPRRLYIPSSGGGGLGLPCFNAGGKAIGIFVSQMPDPEEMQGAGYGWYGASGLILPATEVVKATQRAKEAEDQDEEDDDNVADSDEDDK